MRLPKGQIFHFATIASMALSTLAITSCVNNSAYQQPNSYPTQYPNQYPAQNTGTPQQIVVNDRGVPNYYQVQAGDTIGGIAQRYGVDYRQIAYLNNLDNRYTIYIGQWLRLWQNNNGNQAYYPNNSVENLLNTYQLPTTNPVIRYFDSTTGTTGMWFSGNEGDPVLASLQGTVIYADNGLSEYGNLVLIRHNDQNVTAYAHNKQNLVKEGDLVRTGQRIATMGGTGNTDQVALEFQFRQNGSPIDPLLMLRR